MNYDSRFKLYKELTKIEPKMWTRNHHILRILGNITVANMTMYTFAKVYWNLSPDKFRSMRIQSLIALTLTVSASILFLNYYYLDRFVYGKFYSHLTDEQFNVLYSGILAEHYRTSHRFS